MVMGHITILFGNVEYVTKIFFKHSSNHSFYLAHRYDRHREFSLYKEDSSLEKVFSPSVINKFQEHAFSKPFIAKEIRLHIYNGMSPLLLDFGFSGFMAFSFNISSSTVLGHIHQLFLNAGHEIIIDFGQISYVCGVVFADFPWKRFSIGYMASNGSFVDYKDNKNQVQKTIFHVIHSFIVLRPFYATKMLLVPQDETSGSSNFHKGISVLVWGKQDTLYDHHYIKKVPSFKVPENVSLISDEMSGNLHLASTFSGSGLGKFLAYDNVKSNFVGEECLSAPHLCDDGFSFGFRGLSNGNIHGQSQTYVATSSEIYSSSYHRRSYLQQGSQDILLIHFHFNEVYSSYKLIDAFLYFPTEMNSSAKLNCFFIPEKLKFDTHNNLYSYLFNFSVYECDIIHEYYKGKNFKSTFVRINDIAKILKSKHQVKDVTIAFIPKEPLDRQIQIGDCCFYMYFYFFSMVQRSTFPFAILNETKVNGGNEFEFPETVFITKIIIYANTIEDESNISVAIRSKSSAVDLTCINGNIVSQSELLPNSERYIIFDQAPCRVKSDERLVINSSYDALFADKIRIFGYKNKNNEEIIYPIMSVGRHIKNNETGFTLYRNQTHVNAIVQTDRKRYEIFADAGLLYHYKTWIFTFSKVDGLKLYIEGVLQEQPSTVTDSPGVSVNRQQSLVLFGYYEHQFADAYASDWLDIYISRRVMNEDDILRLSFIKACPQPKDDVGRVLTCLCGQIVCPCPVDQTVRSLQKTYTEASGLVDEETFVFNREEQDGSTLITFENVDLNLTLHQVKDIYISLSLKKMPNASCIVLSAVKYPYVINWCDNFMLNVVQNSPSIKDLFKFWCLERSDLTFILLIGNVTRDSIKDIVTLNIKYTPIITGMKDYRFFYKQTTDITLPVTSGCTCQEFYFVIVGNGHSYIRFELNDKIVRLYPNEVKAKSSFLFNMTTEIIVKSLRNEHGYGYIGFKRKFVQSECNNDGYIFHSFADTYENLKFRMIQNGYIPPVLMFGYKYIALAKTPVTFIRNGSIEENSGKKSTSFQDLFFLSKPMELSIRMSLRSFTITYFGFDKNYAFQIKHSDGSNLLKLSQVDASKITIGIENETRNIEIPESWVYPRMPWLIYYSQYSNVLSFYLGTERIYLKHTFKKLKENLKMEFQVSLQGVIHCLQIYDEIIAEEKLIYQQVDCPNDFPQKKICDLHSRFGYCDISTSLPVYQDFSANKATWPIPKLHLPMDIGVELQLSSTDFFYEPGVVDGALCISNSSGELQNIPSLCTEENCVLTMWMFHTCRKKEIFLQMPFMSLECGSSNFSIFLKDRDCAYNIPAKLDLWYNLKIHLTNQKIKEVYMDEKLVEKKSDCSMKASTVLNIIMASTGKICIDEFYEVNVQADPAISPVNNHMMPISPNNDADERYQSDAFIKRTYPCLYVVIHYERNGIDYANIKKENFALHALSNFLISQLKEATAHVREIVFIEDMFKYEINGKGLFAFYFSTVESITLGLLNNINYGIISSVSLLKGYEFPQLGRIRGHTYFLMEQLSLLADVTIIETDKTSVKIDWSLDWAVEKLPVTKLLVRLYKYNSTGDKEKEPHISVIKTTGYFKLSKLQPFTNYSVCIIPMTLKVSAIIECQSKSFHHFQTAEGEPTSSPEFDCEQRNDNEFQPYFTCNLKPMYNHWNGIPYGYEIFWIQSSRIVINQTFEKWNKSLTSQRKFKYQSTKIQGTFNVNYWFELYTFAIRAITQNGKGKGVFNYIQIRSASGAPEYSPDIKKVVQSHDGNSVIIHWEQLPNNSDIWNSNMFPGTYKIQIHTCCINQNVKIIEHLCFNISGETCSIPVKRFEDDSQKVLAFNLFAVSKYPASPSRLMCFAIKNVQAPGGTHENATSALKFSNVEVNLTLSNLQLWRGKAKYFQIAALRNENKTCELDINNMNVNKTMIQMANSSLTPIHKDINCVFYVGMVTMTNMTSDIYENRSMLCEKYENEISIANERSEHSILLADLHYYTNYTLHWHFCNEFGCSSSQYLLNVEVGESYPSCGPVISFIGNLSSTEILLEWEELPKDCRNGKIVGYYVLLSSAETTIKNFSLERNFVFKNLEKYELYCGKVIAATKVGKGPAGNQMCAFTHIDKPQVSPKNISSEAIASDTVLIKFHYGEEMKKGLNSPYGKVVLSMTALGNKNILVDKNSNIESVLPPNDIEDKISLVTKITAIEDNMIQDKPSISVTKQPNLVDRTVSNNINNGVNQNTRVARKRRGVLVSEIFNYNISDYLNNETFEIIKEKLLPSYRYSCSIKLLNEMGSGPLTFFFAETSEDVPSEGPFNIAILQLYPHNITFLWEGPFFWKWNGIPRYYNVSYIGFRKDGLEEHEQEVIFANTSSTSFKELIPYTSYIIFISACTQVGCSIPTNISFETRSTVPYITPPDVSLLNRTSTSLTFAWKNIPMVQHNGPGLFYQVSLQRENDDDVTSFNTTYLNVTFEELEKFKNYTFTIVARNSKGYGPIHLLHAATESSVPSQAPTNMTSEGISGTEIFLEWNLIPTKYRHGVLLGYVIKYFEIYVDGAIGPEQSVVIKNASVDSYLLNGLTEKGNYYVQIGGYNVKGVGIMSDQVYTETAFYVHGGWSEWTNWEPCSVSCGKGFNLRRRYCNNPERVGHGDNCTGDAIQKKSCEQPTCSGTYLSTPGVLDCNIFCDTLAAFCDAHLRTDNNTKHFESNNVACMSADPMWSSQIQPLYNIEKQECVGYQRLPYNITCSGPSNGDKNLRRLCKCVSAEDKGFSPWPDWGPCSATCGESKRYRRRYCSYSDEYAANHGFCVGLREQVSYCNLNPCPVDGAWGEWGPFRECSKTCGYGENVRIRKCDSPEPKHGGMKCPGPEVDRLYGCNPNPCPIHGGVSEWGEWGFCDAACGVAYRWRYRTCDNPKPSLGGRNCDEDLQMRERCHFYQCKPMVTHFVVSLNIERWTYLLNYNYKGPALLLKENIHSAILKVHRNVTFIERIHVIRFRKGSVLAYFDVHYKHNQRVELLSFAHYMTSSGRLGEMPISLMDVWIEELVCRPPYDVKTVSLSMNTVKVNFTVDLCTNGTETTLLYIYYLNIEEISVKPLHNDSFVNASVLDYKWNVQGVSHEVTSVIIDNLDPSSKYLAYMMQATRHGNTVPGDQFLMNTMVGAPEKSPTDITGFSPTSTSIYLQWTDIPVKYWMKEAIGYKVKYQIYQHESEVVKIVDYGYRTTMLEDLRPHTLYFIVICGFNSGGEGPADFVLVKTLEGVPDIPVPSFSVQDEQSLNWFSVSWKQIPDANINGVLKGYRLVYFMSYRADIPVSGQRKKLTKDFDRYTFYYKITGLVSYATYNVSVTAFTNAGNGPAPEHFAKTCKCSEHLYGIWYEKPLLVEKSTVQNDEDITSEIYNVDGIIPDIAKELIIAACGKCSGYDVSVLHYNKSKTGQPVNWLNETFLKKQITKNVDVAFPIFGQPERIIVPNTSFHSVIPSLGFCLVKRDEIDVQALLTRMILGVISVWPFLIVSYMIMTLFGFLIWFTDQFQNPEEFNRGDAIKGPVIGFWFSFVTMTTVGYGDLSPRSSVSRAISVIWILIGLVLNSIVVGFITTAVTSVNYPEDVSIYNKEVAVTSASFEYRYAVSKNAIVKPNNVYDDTKSILEALKQRKEDMALIETFQLSSFKEKMKEMKLKVVRIIDVKAGFGFVLSGQLEVLKRDVDSLLFTKGPVVSQFISSTKEQVPAVEQSNGNEVSEEIFKEDSRAFQLSSFYMGVMILTGAFLGVCFNIFQFFRKSIKVHSAVPQIETDMEKLTNILEKACMNLQRISDMLEIKHNEEIARLVSLHKGYDLKAHQIGENSVDRWLSDNQRNNNLSRYVETSMNS